MAGFRVVFRAGRRRRARVRGLAVVAAGVLVSAAVGLVPLGPAAAFHEGPGYRLIAADGGVFAFGGARFAGSTGSIRLNSPMVGGVDTPAGHGYWLVAADGGVFAFGDARFAGSTGAIRLSRPIVAMAATPTGAGYWLVAADGGVFAFGDATFLGSTASLPLRSPIVGMAVTGTGLGYWLVAADGGVFRFGDAPFLGSGAGRGLTSPVVGMAAAGTGGYWLATAAGEVLAFGPAVQHGSLAGRRLARPIVAVLADPRGPGFWLVASDGGVFAFGGAPFLGSTGATRLNQPIVAMAAPVAGAGEPIAPGTYVERSDSSGFAVVTGGRVESAGSALGPIGPAERARFDASWSPVDGSARARLENSSGVRMTFPDGLRVVVHVARDGVPWRDVWLSDPSVRGLDPGAAATLFVTGGAPPDGDGRYTWSGETTLVLS